MLRRLRYVLDVVLARLEPYCPHDWNEPHLEAGTCRKCKRANRRWGRIWRYRRERDEREQRKLPVARLL